MLHHGLDTTLFVLAVSVAVGGLAIHVGSLLTLTAESYPHAVVTAGLGGVAWTLVGIAFDALGAPGPLASLAGLVVWIAVLGKSYGVGWVRASLLGIFAWIAALAALGLLAALGVGALDAYGVPGT